MCLDDHESSGDETEVEPWTNQPAEITSSRVNIGGGRLCLSVYYCAVKFVQL